MQIPDRPSVIILPFRNLTGDDEHDCLCEGLRIDIQKALVKVSGLFLIAHGSANAVGDEEPRIACGITGVRYALHGSVRRAGENVRFAVDLTDSDSGEIVWADSIDGVLEDTFTLMDEVASRVLTAMNVKLVSGEPARVWHKILAAGLER